MRCNEDHSIKTIAVMPGEQVEVGLPPSGVLRFERLRGSMAGKPVYLVEDGALTLHYADGASVYINE
jgi:hypothetical protein